MQAPDSREALRRPPICDSLAGMLSFNEARLMGHVGTVNPLQEGAPLRFTVATERSWKDRESGDVQKETEWHRVTVFQPPQRLVNRLAKGARVYVEGRIHHSKYQANGTERTGTEIVARAARVEVLTDAPDTPEPPPADQTWQARPPREDDDQPY